MTKQVSRLGLYTEDGVVKLDGRPFYGFGTNYYDIASRPFYEPDCTDFEVGIRHIREYKLPYIRARFSAWGNEGMDLFWNDREAYFAVLDRCVALCEKHHLGIIAVLCWTTHPYIRYPELTISTDPQSYADFIRRDDTLGYRKMLEYIEAVVTRYRRSPAIWGWEIGNEFNLACDVFPLFLPAEALADFCRRVGEKIREFDGTDRLIETGHSQNRSGSYRVMLRQKKADPWPDRSVWSEEKRDHVLEPDTPDEMVRMLKLYDSPAMTVTSTHLYNRTQILGGRVVPIDEYVRFITDAAKRMGKPIFVGEYCDDEVNGVTNWTPEIRAESLLKFDVLHEAMVNNDVQLAMLWMQSNDRDIYYELNDYHRHMLDRVKRANETFLAAGKQQTDGYWAANAPVFAHG